MLRDRLLPAGRCSTTTTTNTALCHSSRSISSSNTTVLRQHARHHHHHVCAATPGGQQQPSQPPPDEDLLPRALVAIGLNGTIAVAGAALVGVSLPSLFHFDRQADIVAALLYTSPLLLLEAALFIPNYQLPAALLQQQQQQQQQHTGKQQAAVLDVAAISQLTTTSLAAWQATLAGLSMVVRRTPQQQQLALPAALGLLAAREVTKELLQRGFVLAGLAGWLTDRLYEADAADGVMLAGVPITVSELGLLAASVVATLLFSPAAYIAAEEAAAGISGALLLRTEAGGEVRRIAAAAMAARPGGGSSSGRSSGSGGSSGSSPPRGQVNDAVARLQPPPLQPARDSSNGGDVDSGDDDDGPTDPSVLEYRLVKATGDVFGSAPVRIAYSLTLSKELGRLALSNLVFAQVAPNNLAATLVASVVANGLLLVYGRALQQQQQQQPEQ